MGEQQEDPPDPLGDLAGLGLWWVHLPADWKGVLHRRGGAMRMTLLYPHQWRLPWAGSEVSHCGRFFLADCGDHLVIGVTS